MLAREKPEDCDTLMEWPGSADALANHLRPFLDKPKYGMERQRLLSVARRTCSSGLICGEQGIAEQREDSVNAFPESSTVNA